jgi:Mor family transcriptional regulator
MPEPDCFVDVVLIETRHAARANGLDAGLAARLADTLAERLMLRLGGDSLYVPKSRRVDRAAVHEAFDGTNYAELARAHGVTERRIRQILAERRGG